MDQVVRGRVEAGCDEAGRGCLAGPVVAAAVVLTPEVAQTLPLNDSKQLTKPASKWQKNTDYYSA